MVGMSEPWGEASSAGITNGEVEDTVVIPVNSEKALQDALFKRDVDLSMVEAYEPRYILILSTKQ